jgi:hypothetical protein
MNQDDQNQTFTSIAELEILATIGELVAKHGSEAFTKLSTKLPIIESHLSL